MAAHRQPRLIPVEEAARLARRTPAELRRWCATGRLRCERIGQDWFLLEDDIHVAAGEPIIAVPAGERAVLSIAFADERDGRRAYEELRSRFGLGADQLAIAPLALDGAEFVLLAGSVPAGAIDEVLAAAGRLGGIVIDGIDEDRLERRQRRPAANPEQRTYG
jgi:hypothetical protein